MLGVEVFLEVLELELREIEWFEGLYDLFVALFLISPNRTVIILLTYLSLRPVTATLPIFFNRIISISKLNTTLFAVNKFQTVLIEMVVLLIGHLALLL